LRCFVAQEGLVRVCVDAYESPDSRNLHRLTMHLTNYSLSKFSDKFVHSGDPNDANKGCKRTLSAVLQRLQSDSLLQIDAIWQALRILVRQTINAITVPIQELAKQPDTWDGDVALASSVFSKAKQCFHIIGLDILLDDSARPWLLELNNNPSFSIDEVRPLPGVKSRAEANAMFAASHRERTSSKWGRPCRCVAHPRPHSHHQCPVDMAVKLPVIEGALTIVRRWIQECDGSRRSSDWMSWAEGTIFVPV